MTYDEQRKRIFELESALGRQIGNTESAIESARSALEMVGEMAGKMDLAKDLIVEQLLFTRDILPELTWQSQEKAMVLVKKMHEHIDKSPDAK